MYCIEEHSHLENTFKKIMNVEKMNVTIMTY